MNAKKFYLLIVVAVLALLGAYFINKSNQPESDVSAQAKSLLPELHGHVNDVSAITLHGAGDKVLVTLKRGQDRWSVTEKSGYPADLAKIRQFLIKLDQATLTEQKTANPKLYADLGVEDIDKCGQARPLGDSGDQGGSQKCNSVLVELAGLAQPVQLIIGNYNGAGGGGTFVRRVGAAQSWLANGNLTVARTVADWEHRELTDIPSSRFKSVTLTDPDGKTLKVYKNEPGDSNFSVADVPKGREVSSEFVANGLASVLSDLKADDVFVAKDMASPEKTWKDEFTAFDGLIVVVTGWQANGKDYAQLSAKLDSAAVNAQIDQEQAKSKSGYTAALDAAGKKLDEEKSTTGTQSKANAAAASEVPKPLAVSDPARERKDRLDALSKEVDLLNKTFSGWTFALPSYKFADLSKHMDDMLKPLPTKKPVVGENKPGKHHR